MSDQGETPRRPGAPLANLRRFRTPYLPGRVQETCDLCKLPVGVDHLHLVNVDTRVLQCACRACALLFAHDGAAGGRYRAVPDRYLCDPSFGITEKEWERLQIPVRMAFFFYSSAHESYVAFYPSPAGATESLLGLDAWKEIAAWQPLVKALAADVEALIVHRRPEGNFDGYLVPIDACYALVGLVRRHWKGFHGGREAWAEIDRFFAGLRARCKDLAAGADS